MKIGLPMSLNLFFWGCVSFIRVLWEKFRPPQFSLSLKQLNALKRQVAVCMPAHNEEAVLESAIAAITTQIPAQQIYVVSDGSRDATATIARRLNCSVLELSPGRGKARALETLIQKFSLLAKYRYILFVDADTQLEPYYVKHALGLFVHEPEVAAIAAYAIPIWENRRHISLQNFIAAYRTKLYTVLQMFLMYGQTWKYCNINAVIPGFAAMYPTQVLRKLDLVTPGILIEDFNLAFQIHKKNLGWIAHFRAIAARYHDPVNFIDYSAQIRRWNVGFYQTIRKWGVWPSLFWIFTLLFSLEVALFSLVSLFAPLVFMASIFLFAAQRFAGLNLFTMLYPYFIGYLEFIVAIVILDYALTVFIAAKNRAPMLLFWGIGFFLFNLINSWVLLISIPQGLLTRSTGRWVPAKRA